jgi:hypothetical protein
MNIIERITGRPKSVAPVVLTPRDRIAAELEYESSSLPELELLVRFGRRTQEDLDAKRAHVTALQVELDALTKAEAADAALTLLQQTELPREEAALAGEIKDFIKELSRLRDRARSIMRKRDAIVDRFGNHNRNNKSGWVLSVPLANHLLLQLTAGLIREFADAHGTAAQWCKEAKHAGFDVPAEPSSAPVPHVSTHR